MVHRHGLLDEARLAGGRHGQRQLTVARWRRRDVDGIDLRIVDEVVSAIVGPRHTVAARIVLRLRQVAPHHRDERGSVSLLKARTALHLGHVTTADDSPTGHRPRPSLHEPGWLWYGQTGRVMNRESGDRGDPKSRDPGAPGLAKTHSGTTTTPQDPGLPRPVGRRRASLAWTIPKPYELSRPAGPLSRAVLVKALRICWAVFAG